MNTHPWPTNPDNPVDPVKPKFADGEWDWDGQDGSGPPATGE